MPIAIWIVGMLVALSVLWAVFTQESDASPSAATTTSSVRTLIERGAVVMPSAGSGGYRPPRSSERDQLLEAITDIEQGDLNSAAAAVASVHYLVQSVTDSETGNEFAVLRPEDLATPPGWGTYIFAIDAPTGTVIEVPHPRADLFTEQLGVEFFLRSGARWLLVAGANRRATSDADVAHQEGSAFEAIHRAVLTNTAAGPVVQVHGFDGASRNYGDAVVSSGTDDPSTLARALASELTDAGITTCLHDAAHCTDLGGTKNAQGSSTRDTGGEFIHLELAQPLRADPAMRVKIADAIIDAIRRRGS